MSFLMYTSVYYGWMEFVEQSSSSFTAAMRKKTHFANRVPTHGTQITKTLANKSLAESY